MCGTPDAIAPGAALCVLILNIIFFPIGTFVHACLSDNYATSFCNGILMIVLFVIVPPITSVIAYIWGIIYAVRIYNKSTEKAAMIGGGFVNMNTNTNTNQATSNTTIQIVNPMMAMPPPAQYPGG